MVAERAICVPIHPMVGVNHGNERRVVAPGLRASLFSDRVGAFIAGSYHEDAG